MHLRKEHEMSPQPLVEPETQLFGLLLQYPRLHAEPGPGPRESHGQLLAAALDSRFGHQSEIADVAEHMKTWSDDEVFAAINAAADITDLLNAEPHLNAFLSS
jgi:hypothetical protein